jgi:small subunit ribosomal protein S1
LNIGDKVEAKIQNVDKKTRNISLSIRAMEEAEEKEVMRNLNEAPTEEDEVGPTTIGELIKAQMEGRE